MRKRSQAAELATSLGRDPAEAIYDAVRASVFTGRQVARTIGREAIDVRFGVAQNASQVGALLDAQRAQFVARRHLERVRQAAAKAGAAPSAGRWKAALDATEWHARTVAATEAFSAANVERDEAARQASAELGIEIWKSWNAYADACPVCQDEDGTTILVTESFTIGEPGSVHPSCHCWTEIQTHP